MTIPNKFCKNKEWLYDQYVVQKKSYPIIAKELGVQAETVRLWLHRHNIPFRTLSDGKSGELHWNFGNTTPDDVKEKIRQGNIGKVVSQKTKDAISEAMSGENNPRYGVTLSDDQKQRQRSTLLNTYTEHPEIKKQISISRIQYYIDHPNAAQEHSERIKKYYEDPVHRQEQSERLKSFYDNHMLSDEE